ncbi:phosphotransferase [Belliella marina]|uniref:Phosphotransferase n=1 Tax=Belliella marina TaxID=1644146 RepID=A0ABW4VNL5_9BACT
MTLPVGFRIRVLRYLTFKFPKFFKYTKASRIWGRYGVWIAIAQKDRKLLQVKLEQFEAENFTDFELSIIINHVKTNLFKSEEFDFFIGVLGEWLVASILRQKLLEKIEVLKNDLEKDSIKILKYTGVSSLILFQCSCKKDADNIHKKYLVKVLKDKYLNYSLYETYVSNGLNVPKFFGVVGYRRLIVEVHEFVEGISFKLENLENFNEILKISGKISNIKVPKPNVGNFRFTARQKRWIDDISNEKYFDVKQFFKQNYELLEEALNQLPKVFNHLDFNQENFLVDENDKIYIVDYFDGEMGCLGYDLAKFIYFNLNQITSKLKFSLDQIVEHAIESIQNKTISSFKNKDIAKFYFLLVGVKICYEQLSKKNYKWRYFHLRRMIAYLNSLKLEISNNPFYV